MHTVDVEWKLPVVECTVMSVCVVAAVRIPCVVDYTTAARSTIPPTIRRVPQTEVMSELAATITALSVARGVAKDFLYFDA